MRYRILAIATLLGVLSSGSREMAAFQSSQQPAVSSSSPSAQRALLDQYCVTCHNQRSKTANVMFDTMDLANLAQDAKIWERALRKLRGGMMPPPGARQPERASLNAFATWLENSLDQAAAADPNPGFVAVHRMNRAEYANAIEEILAVHVDASALLPSDDVSGGFDNIASVLKVSPAFLDQYISAARFVATQAMGEKAPKPLTTSLRVPVGLDQSVHVEGLPLGTRGGLLVEHLFPADGEYRFSISGLAWEATSAGSNTNILSSSLLTDSVFSPATSAVKRTARRWISSRRAV
jgi:hypothetical protein